MDNKSKLPKLSGLKAPRVFAKTATDKFPRRELAVIPENQLNMAASSSRMRMPTAMLKRRSKSVTDLTAKSSFKKPLTTMGSAGNKRMASKTDDDVIKPKVAKQAKIPDWDYKRRYHALNEKYIKSSETNNLMKGEIHSLTEKLQISTQKYDADIGYISNQCSELQEANSKLKNDLINCERQYQALHSTIQDLKGEVHSLTDKLQISTKKYDTDIGYISNQCSELQEVNSKLKNELINYERQRQALHNTIQELKGNIRVFCRVRPPVSDHESEWLQCSFNFVDDTSFEMRKSTKVTSTTGKPTDVMVDFTFDRVFDQESTQVEIFEELSQLVQSALDGFNVCVFAYGQTGSGKTYTMQGSETPEDLGLIPRAIDLIFDSIKSLTLSGWSYQVRASFLEIYNETLHDLLNLNTLQALEIYYNEGKGTTVTNLTEKQITSAKELRTLMSLAHENRRVAATNFNERSSRSHAVTKITLEGLNPEARLRYAGSLSLVDLAGSESAKTSTDERMSETKSINKSLSALGNVMTALHNKDRHVPYRNSKLTYLLQSSLGGNSKTLMVVNVSPFEQNFAESINSLRFAKKVKEIKTTVRRNKVKIVTSSFSEPV